ncbi:hypothetical protein EVAR_65825_1 [Eumeta japonica]|uniref:Uncharacterized protein n=1 Tax=Eumeta variegata TaxID=151549 RepID=A0A4C1ZND1_EUMVA|nr:hypothetical protein EVAR_65825_1 [Eumeta japonica]
MYQIARTSDSLDCVGNDSALYNSLLAVSVRCKTEKTPTPLTTHPRACARRALRLFYSSGTHPAPPPRRTLRGSRMIFTTHPEITGALNILLLLWQHRDRGNVRPHTRRRSFIHDAMIFCGCIDLRIGNSELANESVLEAVKVFKAVNIFLQRLTAEDLKMKHVDEGMLPT